MWIEIDDPDERAEEVFTQLLELAALGDDDARGLVVELAAGKLGKGALSSMGSVIGKVTSLPGGRKLYHGANDGKFKSHKDIGVAPAAGHGTSSNEPTALESAPKVTSHTGVPTKPVMPVSQAETPASVSPSGVPLNEATLDQVAPTKVNKNGMRTLGTEKEGTDWANVSAKKPFWWAQNMSKDHSRYKVVNPSDEKEGHIVKGADGLWRKEGPNKGEGVGHGWPSHKMAFQAMVADGKRRHELAQSKLAGGPDENGDEEWFLDKDTTGAPLTLDDADPLPTTGSSSSGAYKAEGSGYEKWAVTGPDGSLTGDTVVYGEDLQGKPAYTVTGPHGHVHDYPSLDAALDGLEKDIADEEAAKKLSSKKDALTLYKEALEDGDVPAIQEAFKNAMAAGAVISELDEIYTKHHAKKAAPKPEPKPTAAFASTAVPPAPDPDAKKASSNFAETSGMHGLLKATEVPGTDYVSVTDGTGMQAATLHRNEDGLYRNIADTGGSYMALKDAVALEEQRLIDASPAKAKQSKLAVTTKAGATLVPRSSLGTAFNVYGGDLGLKLGEITQAPAGWLGKDGSLHPSMEPAADSFLPKAPAAPTVSTAAPSSTVSVPSSDPLALHTGGPLTPSAPSAPLTPKGKAPADAWEESTGGASYMQPKVKSSKTPGAFNVYESGTDKKLATVKKDWSDGGKYVAPDGTKFITAKALLDHMESSGPASPSAGPAPSASPGTSGPKPKAFSAGPLTGKDDRASLDASGLPGTSGALSAPPLMPPSGANWNKGASDAVKEALNGAPLSAIADKYGQTGRSKNRAASRVASRLSGFSTDDLIRGNNAEHLRKRVEEARKAAGPNGTVTVRPVSTSTPTRALIVEGFPPGAGTGMSGNVDIESPEGQQLLAGHVSSLMINSWAQTSNDSHKGALALQQAAAAEFGLGRTEEWKMSDSLKQEVADEYAANEAFYRAFLRAQYDITQEDLRARGLTHVRLFRGMRFSSAQEKPDWAKTMFNGLSYTQERVLDPSPSPQLRPMSSFSSAKSTANDFMKNYGSGGDKMLIEAMVPIEHILSTPQSGFGCLDESEFVVLAPEQGDVKVTVRKG